MKGVTIDQLRIEDYKRYAEDQIKYDPSFSKDAAPLSETLGISSNYSEKIKELFGLYGIQTSFATFPTPPFYWSILRRRYFGNCILPTLESEVAEEEDTTIFEELRERVLNFDAKGQSADLVERERTSLINLFDALDNLNELLKEINADKIRYQKG